MSLVSVALSLCPSPCYLPGVIFMQSVYFLVSWLFSSCSWCQYYIACVLGVIVIELVSLMTLLCSVCPWCHCHIAYALDVSIT